MATERTDSSVRVRTRKRKVNAKVKAKAKAKVKAKRNQRDGGVSQKVWRGQPGRARVTPPTIRRSRRYNAPTQHDERSQVVKTLRDATLKMKGLHTMMDDFVVASKKVDYGKVHTKWRKMKRQIQFGGDNIKMFNPDAPPTDKEPNPFFRTVNTTLVTNGKYIINTHDLSGNPIRYEYIPVDTATAEQKKKIEQVIKRIESDKAAAAAKKTVVDTKKADVNADDESESDDADTTKDCVEKKERPTFLVKQSAVNPDKFAVERIDTDSIIEGSLTKTAERFMKSTLASNSDDDDIDENEDGITGDGKGDGTGDGTDTKKGDKIKVGKDINSDGSKEDTELRIAAAGVILIALDALKNVNDVVASTSDEMTRAAAAMIAIALGGLIRKDDKPEGLKPSSISSSVQTDNIEDTETKEALKKAEEEKATLEAQLAAQQNEVRKKQDEVTRLQEELANSGGTNAALKHQLQAAIEAQAAAKQARDELAQQFHDAQADLVTLQQQHQAALGAARQQHQTDLGATQTALRAARSDTLRLNRELAQAQAAAASAQHLAREASAATAQAQADANDAEARAHDAEARAAHATARTGANAQDIIEARREAHKALGRATAAQNAANQAAQREAAARQAETAAQQERASLEQELRALQQRHKEALDAAQQQHQTELGAARGQTDRLTQDLERVRAQAEQARVAAETETAKLRGQLAELNAEAERRNSESDRQASDQAAAEASRKFDARKKVLTTRLDDAKRAIGSMKEDDQCKPSLDAIANTITAQIGILTHANIDSLETSLGTELQNLSEATGSKIRTYVAMRAGEENTSHITFDKENKKVKTPAQGGGGLEARDWGAFSDVFDTQSGNQQKYEGMKDILDPIPDGNTVVVFGYGYSGSGKTYTLLGGINSNKVWDDGIAQRAINDYLNRNCTVELDDAFEMYNDTYSYSNARGAFEYKQPTTIASYNYKNMLRLESSITRANTGFKNACFRIEEARKKNHHILPTPNNKVSSRGHLFIKLKITANGGKGTHGYLIICDMGGRENPKEIWETGHYYKGANSSHAVTVLGPVSKTDPSKYYSYESYEELTIPPKKTNTVSTVHAVLGDAAAARASLKTGIESTGGAAARLVRKTLQQGFYINDSINEMLAQFGYKFKTEKNTNWTGDSYDPDTRAIGFSESVGILKIFEDFKKDSECKIKFCTFACIRPSATFAADSIATLKFAEAVNSCVVVNPVAADDVPAAAAAAAAPPPPASAAAHPSTLSAPDVTRKAVGPADITVDSASRPAAGLSTKDLHRRDLTSKTKQFPGDTNDSSQVGSSFSQSNGGSLRKKSKRNKNKNSKSTLKAKSKTKSTPAHNHQKKKFTRKHKHNNKNKSTIKNKK